MGGLLRRSGSPAPPQDSAPPQHIDCPPTGPTDPPQSLQPPLPPQGLHVPPTAALAVDAQGLLLAKPSVVRCCAARRQPPQIQRHLCHLSWGQHDTMHLQLALGCSGCHLGLKVHVAMPAP